MFPCFVAHESVVRPLLSRLPIVIIKSCGEKVFYHDQVAILGSHRQRRLAILVNRIDVLALTE